MSVVAIIAVCMMHIHNNMTIAVIIIIVAITITKTNRGSVSRAASLMVLRKCSANVLVNFDNGRRGGVDLRDIPA
jgi:hypothetical protein